VGEQAGFQTFHANGIAGMVMIVAGKMQGAVDDQMGKMMSGWPLGSAGFAQDGAQGKNDFGRGFVGEYVGGFVSPTIPPVEAFDRAIIRENDCGGAVGQSESAGDQPGRGGDDCVPARIRDDDFPAHG
jgi:hypothetical protein